MRELLQRFANWRWGPPLVMVASVVALNIRPRPCHSWHWWEYLIPVAIFTATFTVLWLSGRRHRG